MLKVFAFIDLKLDDGFKVRENFSFLCISGMNHKDVVACLKNISNGVRLVCSRSRPHAKSNLNFSQNRENFFKPSPYTVKDSEASIERMMKSRSEQYVSTQADDKSSLYQKSV